MLNGLLIFTSYILSFGGLLVLSMLITPAVFKILKKFKNNNIAEYLLYVFND